MDKSDGMNYAPRGKAAPVVEKGEFLFAAIGLDHGHIYGMCNGLTEAGATLKYVYDPDPEKVKAFCEAYPGTIFADKGTILADKEVKLIASAAVASERCALGIEAMRAGKDYFADKAPLTTLKQLELAKKAVLETGKKYMCYFAERLHVEAAVYAGQLIEQGAVGRVLQVTGFGPHHLNESSRPSWFFEKDKYGGILCDIGSHQIEQFLFYSGAENARIESSHIANYANPKHPGLDDYGDVYLVGDNGTSGYFRLDWFTPDGLPFWGDGRIFILGTEGSIELRKYCNVATSPTEDHVFLINGDGEHHFEVHGKVGYPFFGQLILDCINRTENAMTQKHVFLAAELSIRAQMNAERLA